MFKVYDLYDYGWMIADRVRTDAYAQALRQVVKPGSVVLDIGTGTGIWPLLACKSGARRVYAIDVGPVIQVARELAAAHGYAARITFMQAVSTQVALPEQVDVIVAEIHGVLPLFQTSVVSIADARRRLLAPGGTLIPRSETLWAAVVEAPEIYTRHSIPWVENRYGIDMRAVLRYSTNTFRRCRVVPEQLLGEPKCWATLDYAVLESPDVCGAATWTAKRAGIAHGLSVWFDAALAEGVSLSNAPDAPELIFGSAFFPWARPVNIDAGDTVSVTLQADLVGEDYIWRWDTCVLNQGHPGQVKATFKQSTFLETPFSTEQLQRAAATHRPTLNEDGQINRYILTLMDGQTSLGDIARQLSHQFRHRFTTYQDALAHIAELSQAYSR